MEFLPFLVATVVGCGVAGLGYWFSRRAGLGVVQAEYVTTLRDINDSLDQKLRLMQEQLDKEKMQVEALSVRVRSLEASIVDLTLERDDLRTRLKAAVDDRIAALEAENQRLLRGGA